MLQFYYQRSEKRWANISERPAGEWFNKTLESCLFSADPECQVKVEAESILPSWIFKTFCDVTASADANATACATAYATVHCQCHSQNSDI